VRQTCKRQTGRGWDQAKQKGLQLEHVDYQLFSHTRGSDQVHCQLIKQDSYGPANSTGPTAEPIDSGPVSVARLTDVSASSSN
jgi:hypothetical protein